MKKAKNKLTYKQILTILTGMDRKIQEQKMIVFNVDKLLQEFLDFKGETEAFKKFLEEKYTGNDKDNKETEEK